jgi:membrane protease YdiL (CAAX protease family)
VAPISEEILYRGVLFQGLLNRFGPLAAALLSAFIFTIVHFYGLYGTLGVGILGVALALVYHATRSLPAVIIFHAIYNLTAILPDWIVNHGPLGP